MSTATGLAFPLLCRVQDLPEPMAEYAFHPERRWRFDFCWPDHLLALEIEGGVWVRGRHIQPRGYLADLEKYNHAAACGWRILRVTPEQLSGAPTFDLVRRALAARVLAA